MEAEKVVPKGVKAREEEKSVGMSKDEVDAYIVKVKAGVDAVAKARAEKETPVEVEVKSGGSISHGDGNDKLRDVLLSTTYTPRS